MVFISNGKATCFGLWRPSSGFHKFFAKEFYIICLNRVAILRSHHHLRTFVKLSLVGCLLRQWISSSSVICQTTGPKPLPKRFLHIVRSRASSFNWQYPLLFLRSSSSFLRLLPRLLVASICPFIFPSITCFRRQFLRKMWSIQLAFRFLISCRIFLCSLTLSNTS